MSNSYSSENVWVKYAYFGLKDGASFINLDAFKSIGTHWIALYVNVNIIIYLDCLGAELITKKSKSFL